MIAISTVTRSGQLPIPVDVRRHLGVAPGDRILWTTDAAGNTIVRPMQYTLEELDGIIPAIDHPSAETDFEDMIDEAREALVDEHLREIGLR